MYGLEGVKAREEGWGGLIIFRDTESTKVGEGSGEAGALYSHAVQEVSVNHPNPSQNSQEGRVGNVGVN